MPASIAPTSLRPPQAVVVTVDKDQCLRIYLFRVGAHRGGNDALPAAAPARRLQRLDDRTRPGDALDGHGRLAPRLNCVSSPGSTDPAWIVGQGGHWNVGRSALEAQREEWLKSEQGVTELAAELSSLSL